jgi:gamma-glutamyltranspeptidase/glutathione hydrolase
LLVNIIDFKLNIQLAGDVARIKHVGGTGPTDEREDEHVFVESGVGESVRKQLRARGHNVSVRKGEYGGYQGVWLAENGVLHGASESRKDGCALGVL